MLRFTSGTFGLHASEVRDVTLRCHKSLVDTIMDRFGTDVPFTIIDKKHFEVTVPAVMNADFYGWVFSLGRACDSSVTLFSLESKNPIT